MRGGVKRCITANCRPSTVNQKSLALIPQPSPMKKSLRTLALTFLILNFSFFIANAQWVSIPDTIFGIWLNNFYPNCMQGNSQQGWLMDTTCSDVVNETNAVFTFQILDLTGIQYFDSLKILNCSN